MALRRRPSRCRPTSPRWSPASTTRCSYTYAGKHGDIPLGLFCRQSLVEHLDADELIEVTEQGFAFFEEAFGYPYPFGKYDQLFVPEYNMGAMENAGCVTFRDEYLPRSRQDRSFYEFRADAILHEMAHMWFGDLVTMKWWDDLWLNESFAEWACYHAAVEATEFTEAWTGFTNARKNWAYRQDQLPSTHPIAADNYDLQAVEVNFDGITYAKGASVLKQLVAWVGLENFLEGFAGLLPGPRVRQLRVQGPADGAGEVQRPRARVVGEGVAADRRRQHARAASSSSTPTARYSSFAVRQTAHPDYPTLRRHRLGHRPLRRGRRPAGAAHLARDRRRGRAHRGRRARRRRSSPTCCCSTTATWPTPRSASTSARSRPWSTSIETIDDSLARALCWGAAWDMTRDAEMRRPTSSTLVLSGIGVGDRPDRRQPLPAYAAHGRGRSTPRRRNRAALRATWESGLRRAADDRRAGQRPPAVVRAGLRRAAHSDQALADLAGLLDGSLDIDGLAVDADLRWTLLTAPGPATAAPTRPGSTTSWRATTRSPGKEHAAAARALRPTAEAKAEAWEVAVVRDDVANETQRSIVLAFAPTARTRCWRRTSRSTSPSPTRSGRTRAPSAPRRRWSSSSRSTWPAPSSLERLDAWLESSPANPAAKRYVQREPRRPRPGAASPGEGRQE